MESQQRMRENEKLSDMNYLKESWAISWFHKYRQICMFLIDNESASGESWSSNSETNNCSWNLFQQMRMYVILQVVLC